MMPLGREFTVTRSGWRVVSDRASALGPPRVRWPPLHRFDDPLGKYGVCYAAEELYGALIETMARLRDDIGTEKLLSAIPDADDPATRGANEADHLDRYPAVRDWLDQHYVVEVQVTDPNPSLLLNVNNTDVLYELDQEDGVRQELDLLGRPYQGTTFRFQGQHPLHLDQALIRLGAPLGRPLTQAVSRAAHDVLARHAAGLVYSSRLAANPVPCWALWSDRTEIWPQATPLTPDDPVHRESVRQATELLKIPLEAPWA